MGKLDQWLRKHGLEQYLDVFTTENITFDLLGKLQPEDLRELGLSVGHRRIFLDAITAAREKDTISSELKPADAERRQLTLMFVDLVGSTELSEQHDPEEMADLLRLYNRTVEQQIELHNGYIARYMGDGMLVYFGWPKAREDDAHRSVLAGLAIVSRVGSITDKQGNVMMARIGIDSGLVVVGEIIGQGNAQEEAVVGDAPNRAARLQALANPGQVVIGPQTKSRLGASFDFESLGLQTLRGIRNQIEPWLVLGIKTNVTRFQARSGLKVAPLIGRKKELDAIADAIERGGFHGFFITGEAGAGKSRLVHELDQFYLQKDVFKIHYQCSPNHSNTFMHPVVEQLQQQLLLNRTGDRLALIKEHWYLPHPNSSDHIMRLAGLLEVPTPEPITETESPQRQRTRTLEVLVENCCARSKKSSCIVIFEDLQWADSSTLELVRMFFRMADSDNILLIGNYRTEFRPPSWLRDLHAKKHCSVITLNPLPTDSAITLLTRLAEGMPLQNSTLLKIVELSDGNPLYLEELSRSFIESQRTSHTATTALHSGSVPPTLHDALMERLDNLNSARYIAQVGAVIGREFQARLIEKISRIDSHKLATGLQELLEASIILRKDSNPGTSNTDATYIFRHALIQQSAYDSLLLNNRNQLHLTLANHLFDVDDHITESHMENIARHYTLAGDYNQAAQCWLRAAQSLYTKAAMTDALACAREGIKALEHSQVDSDDGRECLLDLHFIRGHAAAQQYGGASREAELSFEIAESICENIGNTKKMFAVNFGLFYHHWERLETHKAVPTALKMRELATAIDSPIASMVAGSSFGAINFHVGDVIEADQYLNAAYQLYQPHMHAELVRDYGFNMGLFSGVYYSLSRMGRGYLTSASNLLNECIKHAFEVNHGPSTCYTLTVGLSLRLMLKECPQSIIKHCDKCIELSLTQDLPFWSSFATIIKGAALSRGGAPSDGLKLIDEGIASWLETGSTITVIWWYSLCSEAHLAANDHHAALQAARKAIEFTERTRELQFLSEALIAKGQALKALGDHNSAESFYKQAIKSSTTHHNLYAELRSTIALARLYIEQGRHLDAKEFLTPVYQNFPESGDNTYLIEASNILSQINNHPT